MYKKFLLFSLTVVLAVTGLLLFKSDVALAGTCKGYNNNMEVCEHKTRSNKTKKRKDVWNCDGNGNFTSWKSGWGPKDQLGKCKKYTCNKAGTESACKIAGCTTLSGCSTGPIKKSDLYASYDINNRCTERINLDKYLLPDTHSKCQKPNTNLSPDKTIWACDKDRKEKVQISQQTYDGNTKRYAPAGDHACKPVPPGFTRICNGVTKNFENISNDRLSMITIAKNEVCEEKDNDENQLPVCDTKEGVRKFIFRTEYNSQPLNPKRYYSSQHALENCGIGYNPGSGGSSGGIEHWEEPIPEASVSVAVFADALFVNPATSQPLPLGQEWGTAGGKFAVFHNVHAGEPVKIAYYLGNAATAVNGGTTDQYAVAYQIEDDNNPFGDNRPQVTGGDGESAWDTVSLSNPNYENFLFEDKTFTNDDVGKIYCRRVRWVIFKDLDPNDPAPQPDYTAAYTEGYSYHTACVQVVPAALYAYTNSFVYPQAIRPGEQAIFQHSYSSICGGGNCNNRLDLVTVPGPSNVLTEAQSSAVHNTFSWPASGSTNANEAWRALRNGQWSDYVYHYFTPQANSVTQYATINEAFTPTVNDVGKKICRQAIVQQNVPGGTPNLNWTATPEVCVEVLAPAFYFNRRASSGICRHPVSDLNQTCNYDNVLFPDVESFNKWISLEPGQIGAFVHGFTFTRSSPFFNNVLPILVTTKTPSFAHLNPKPNITKVMGTLWDGTKGGLHLYSRNCSSVMGINHPFCNSLESINQAYISDFNDQTYSSHPATHWFHEYIQPTQDDVGRFFCRVLEYNINNGQVLAPRPSGIQMAYADGGYFVFGGADNSAVQSFLFGTSETPNSPCFYVPYNYQLNPQLSLDGSEAPSPGSSVSFKAHVSNPGPTKSQPSDKWQLTSFIVPAGTEMPIKPTSYHDYGDTNDDSMPCAVANSLNPASLANPSLRCQILLSGSQEFPFQDKTLLNNLSSLAHSFNYPGGQVSYTARDQESFTLHIPDTARLGDKFCVALSTTAAIYNTSYLPSIPNPNPVVWRHSPPVCVEVSKSPNAHVYGAGLLVPNGHVTGKVTKISNSTGTQAYASWVEYDILARGNINHVASTKFSLYNNHYIQSNGGGHNDPYQVYWHNLSFANSTSSGNRLNSYSNPKVGNFNISSSLSNHQLELYNYFSHFAKKQAANKLNDNVLHIGSSLFAGSEDIIYRYHEAGQLYVEGGTIPKGKTLVIIQEDGDLFIRGNIHYQALSQVDSYTDYPQVVIIVKNGNLTITDNVTNIDAWLVASGTNQYQGKLYTCNLIDQLSSKVCNQQLRINGPVIVDYIDLVRTYGADKSDNTLEEAAEVFNFRPDAYLWIKRINTAHQVYRTTLVRDVVVRY